MALRLKRLRLRKNGPKRKRRLLSVRPVPTMITLGNLLCGFGAIVLAMRIHTPPTDLPPADCLYYAGLLIFVAMVFDALDGTVARWTNQTSRFGLEMDSLADVVTFGVAPAVIVKAAIDFFGAESFPGGPYPILDRYVWLMLAVYVACAALRLARYNVESGSSHSDFFFGMPSPGAAGCVASLMVMLMPVAKHLQHLEQLKLVGGEGVVREKIPFLGALNYSEATALLQVGLIVLPFLMLCLGILMVSRVHYLHLGEKLLSGRRSFMHFLILGLALVLIVMQHEVMLALAFNGYMLLGLFNEVRYQLIPSQRPKGWVASADEELHRLQQAHGEDPAAAEGAEAPTAGAPDAPPAEPEANAHHAGD